MLQSEFKIYSQKFAFYPIYSASEACLPLASKATSGGAAVWGVWRGLCTGWTPQPATVPSGLYSITALKTHFFSLYHRERLNKQQRNQELSTKSPWKGSFSFGSPSSLGYIFSQLENDFFFSWSPSSFIKQ